jgi:predicted permease
MNLVDVFVRKVAILFRRNRFRSELDEEMAFHREHAEKELIAGGMDPAAAHVAAARQFGNATTLRETSHSVIAFRLETIVQDIRFALRQLRRNPGFAITAMLILALGMGASVAIFGFVDSALLEPLPYANPTRLMDVGESSAVHPRSNLSYLDFRDWQRLNRSFASLDAYTGGGFLLHTASGTVPIPAARVTGGFFQTLGVRPILGRDFKPGEDRPGTGKEVMLTYGAWMNRFGGSNSAIGQSMTLDSDNYTIIGVLPRDFSFAPRGSAEIWVPITDLSSCEKRRSCHNLYAVGRLRDGITQAAAFADLKAIAAQLERMYPENKGQGASVKSLSEEIVGDVRPILLTLLAGSALLLVIACVNVASLLLVRSESRRREVAVRGALGATHLRLMRQFVTEGMLLAALGSVAGIGVALWLMKLLVHLVPKAMADGAPFISLVGLNPHTVLFAGCIAAVSTVLLATTPMMRLGFQHIHDGLSEGARGAAGRLWKRLGANLAVVELAIAVVLLVGAGLLGRSFYKLLHVDIGFDTSHLAVMNVQLPPMPSDDKTTKARRLEAYRAVDRALAELPGVQSVGLTSDPPVQCLCDTDWIRIVGKPFNGEHNEVDERDVSPSYLPTLKARLVRGRFFREDEDGTKPQVIVINEALARKYFPGEDPIGKKIADGGLTPNSMREVVGVVADFREGALDDEMWPAEYFNIYQQPDTGFTVMVRTAQDEKAALPVIVAALHKLDPSLGVYGETTMDDLIESTESAMLHRFSAWLVGGFAVIALLLSVVGLYGVIAYSVSQRTREIGVRMALGAQRSTVYRMVMRQAGWLTAFGVGIGLVCAVGASSLMTKLLFGVAAWDIPTLATVAFVLGSAALAAGFLPARRAASVNPTEALRAE